MANITPMIDKLVGRSNYNNWAFAMQAYLEHEDLWSCVMGTDATAAAAEKLKRDTRAKSKIIMLIDQSNFVHIRNAASAQEIWKKLKDAFQDKGLTRKVGLMRKMILTKLSECSSMENYVSTVMTTAQMLNDIQFEVNDEWVGTFLLAGLPETYKPMIMAIENSGAVVTGDFVKTKLLQEVKVSDSSASDNVALYSGKGSKNKLKKFRCYNCNGFGHIATNCKKSKKKEESNEKSSNKKIHEDKSLLSIFAVGEMGSSNDWYIDSGASAHMTCNGTMMTNVKPVDEPRDVVMANNERLSVENEGEFEICLLLDGEKSNVRVKKVLHVPDLSANLLSISQMVKNDKKVIFDQNGCRIYDLNGELTATASLHNDIYKLDVVRRQESSFAVRESKAIWHRRLGHVNDDYLKKLKQSDTIQFSDENCCDKCDVCLKGKQTRLPFSCNGTRANDILEIVHADLCGPMEEVSLGGARYVMVLVDDFSRKVFVYLLKSKGDAVDKFVDFKNCAENQMNKKLKILRTDNGSEFCNENMESILRKTGVKHQKTTPYTPEQNGLCERMNRTLIEKARCMLIDANLPKKFWAESVNTASHIINRCPSRVLNGKTPEEVWTGKKPTLKYLRVFGCVCHIHVPKEKRKKFDPKSEACIFMGYSDESKAYRVYQPIQGKVIISRDVIFSENQQFKEVTDNLNNHTNYFDLFSACESAENDQPIIVDDNHLSQIEPENPNIEGRVSECRSVDVQTIPTTLNDIDSDDDSFFTDRASDSDNISSSDDEFILKKKTNVVGDENINQVRTSSRTPKPKVMSDFVTYQAVCDSNCVDSDPVTVAEALNRPDADAWKKAMQSEYDALIKNGTWEIVDLPENRKAINSKWVFKTKKDMAGNIIKYKARLVIKGCAQRSGIDYSETYSPVVRYNSIRFLLAMAAKYDLEIDQMDAVSAFLQGDLTEKIYMVQPECFAKGAKVCCLKKSLYGLKQASRVWNEKLDSALKSFGMEQSVVDPCIYFKSENGCILIVAVYVDDILIFSNNLKLKNKLKNNLKNNFEMKDIGEVKNILGMQITRNRSKGTISISQEQYIREILCKFNMADCNPVSTPMETKKILSNEMCPKTESEKDKMKNIPYQEAVGSILYAAQVSRPDICYAVNKVSRFNQNPGMPHWNAVKRILRYLKGTASMQLTFQRNESSELLGYCDADWASDVDQRRSTTGFVFTLQGGPISWNSKRQNTVALSTTEAEYMAMVAAAQEGLWLNKLQQELFSSDSDCVLIYCDNKSAINLSQTNMYHPRTKHIDIKHHFLKDLVANCQIKPEYISTDEMIADVLTKPLPKQKHEQFSSAMGLISIKT